MPRAVTESAERLAVRCLAVVTAALVLLALLAVVVMAQRVAPRVVLSPAAPFPTHAETDPDTLPDRADGAAQLWTGTDAGLITTPAQ